MKLSQFSSKEKSSVIGDAPIVARQKPGVFASLIAAAFGVFFVSLTVQAIVTLANANVIAGRHNTILTSFGATLIGVSIVLPVVLFAATWVIVRRRKILVHAWFYAIAFGVATSFYFDVLSFCVPGKLFR